LLDHAGEGLGEAGTFGQHDQHPIAGTHVEVNQRSDDCSRLITWLGIALIDDSV
jgi:hypothetical protein